MDSNNAISIIGERLVKTIITYIFYLILYLIAKYTPIGPYVIGGLMVFFVLTIANIILLIADLIEYGEKSQW
jgi:hypothetical protein